jgi:membrane protein DedA with SNARE-associated domain
MSEFLSNIADFVASLDPAAIYMVMLLVAYLENVIPPIPGDVLIVYGGYLAAEGHIAFVPLLILSSISATAGFMTYFYLGWRWGDEASIAARHKYLSRFMDTSHIDRPLRYMKHYGEWVILANRFLAGTRSIISLAAGLSRMNWWQTMLNSFLSSILWNAILISAGWQLKANWSVFGGYLKTYGQVIGILLAVAIALFWLWKRRSGKVIHSEKNHSPLDN